MPRSILWNFVSEIFTSCLNRISTQMESLFFFVFSDKSRSLFYFFRTVVSVTSLGQNQKQQKGRLLFCWLVHGSIPCPKITPSYVKLSGTSPSNGHGNTLACPARMHPSRSPRCSITYGMPRMLLVLVRELNPAVVRFWTYLQKWKRANSCWECLAWVSTVRRRSTREERAENLLAIKMQGTNRTGEGGEEPARWPRPDLR